MELRSGLVSPASLTSRVPRQLFEGGRVARFEPTVLSSYYVARRVLAVASPLNPAVPINGRKQNGSPTEVEEPLIGTAGFEPATP